MFGRRNKTLRSQARRIIYDVHSYMEKESRDGVEYLKQNQARTAAATKVSLATVKRIIKEGNKHSDLTTGFRTPGKNRSKTKPVTGIDDFDKCLIRRCIHKFHIAKEVPTISKLAEKVRNDVDFRGSRTSLRRIIKDLGFRWKQTDHYDKVLIEKSNIRLKRIEYLQNITKYRQEGRPIIYIDESYYSNAKNKQDHDYTQKQTKSITKGPRVVMVHAASENGFIPNALLTSKLSVKQDYLDYKTYEKWLTTQLIPNLPPNAVVVFDNTPNHNKAYESALTSNSKLSDMKSWLTQKGIPYSPQMLKPQLYKLITMHKEYSKEFKIDKILAENNHDVLRLPADHPDLNPMEMAWSIIDSYVCRKNVERNLDHAMELIKEKVNQIGLNEWRAIYDQTKEIEETYIESDQIIDNLTERKTIINLGNCSDSDSEDSTSSSDQDDIFSADREEQEDSSEIDQDPSDQDGQTIKETHPIRKRPTTESGGNRAKVMRLDIDESKIDYDNLDNFGLQMVFLLKRLPRKLCRELQDTFVTLAKNATEKCLVETKANVTPSTSKDATPIQPAVSFEIGTDPKCNMKNETIAMPDNAHLKAKQDISAQIGMINTFHEPMTVYTEVVESMDCVKEEVIDPGESYSTEQEYNDEVNATILNEFDPLETEFKIEIVETDLLEEANRRANSDEYR